MAKWQDDMNQILCYEENPANDSYAYRTKCRDERTRPNAHPPPPPPNGANNGANEVETSRGLGLASLNINFRRQTARSGLHAVTRKKLKNFMAQACSVKMAGNFGLVLFLAIL